MTIFSTPTESKKALEQALKDHPKAFISAKEVDGLDKITFTVYSRPYTGKNDPQPEILHQITL